MVHSEPIALSLHTMATRFELLLHGENPVRLRAAGEEALAEIARLHKQLSFYDPSSEISFINRNAGGSPVKTDPRLIRMLADCIELAKLTHGCFDITIGPLVTLWRVAGETGRLPDDSELTSVRRLVGTGLIELDEQNCTVRLRSPGVEIDLGAYAKGYAIGRAIDLLRDAVVTSALLHGGTSSVYALGAPPDQPAWRVALQEPLTDNGDRISLDLTDRALSVSAVHGRSFVIDGRTYGHVIDPRVGLPVKSAVAAAVTGAAPSVCEALSTALLVGFCRDDEPIGGREASKSARFKATFPEYSGFVAFDEALKIPVVRL